MSTQPPSPQLAKALASVPTQFRDRILKAYVDLREAFDEGSFDTAALRVGRFCESVLRFLQHHLTNASIPFGTKIQNLSDECRKLERLPASAGPENLRVIMPRALNFAYTLRNKRGIGHVGGDVDANQIDAATAVRVADWCLCELMRVFHALSLEDAQAILDAISVRQLPQVWAVAGKKRVLETTLDAKAKTLLLLHSELGTATPVEDLAEWIEYGRVSDFRRRILAPLHRARLVELDGETDTVVISPKGAKKVEEEILPKVRP